MISAADASSGKTHRDENFPVASRLVAPRHRAPILAFYRFVRAADDVADHPRLSSAEKLALLDRLEAALTGAGASDPEAEPLKEQLAARGLSPRHALDLLAAFKLDVRKLRYNNFSELMDYCRLSAMPVGRFVLDVHGEDPGATWPASDPICAALQIINHLQDCAADYRNLDRVYLPLDLLAMYGAKVEDLAAPRAAPGLRAAIVDLARRAGALLDEGAELPALVRDRRLAMEIAVIHRLASVLVGRLERRDPLFENVHLGKASSVPPALAAIVGAMLRRPAAGSARAASALRGRGG